MIISYLKGKKSLNSAPQLYQEVEDTLLILNFINSINMLKENASFYCHLERNAEILHSIEIIVYQY